MRALVAHLQALAVNRNSDFVAQPAPWWMRLYNDARRVKREPRMVSSPLGKPIRKCDPIELEVHPAISTEGQQATTSAMPVYVPRQHDTRLDELAAQAIAGHSRMITLVGGSSTGKTRACWELIQRLEQRQPGRWRIWHPYDPTRPDAAAATLERVGPDTIIWLNEAQFYLAPPDPRLGEQVAARLRTLLNDSYLAPALILATLWPEHWATLTIRPSTGQPDPHSQARELLTGTDIDVPDAFSDTELSSLRQANDPRLRQAAEHAETGRITQYLAGAPELESRYRKAPPAARAIIDVAIDARRLGLQPAIPYQLLAQAAAGYLDDHDWDTLDDGWLEQALAYTSQPCNGARGPLTRIRPRPTHNATSQPTYRLADYLEQLGRTTRAGVYPPISFWDTVADTVTDPDTLHVFADSARARCRYPRAAMLYRKAANYGDTAALVEWGALRVQAGDLQGAANLYRRAAGP